MVRQNRNKETGEAKHRLRKAIRSVQNEAVREQDIYGILVDEQERIRGILPNTARQKRGVLRRLAQALIKGDHNTNDLEELRQSYLASRGRKAL
jgi:hypothetical protein